MDPKTGMYPENWVCLRCGKQLNADGGHPAETYAGTFNGLCYACTAEGGYVEKIHELDGCRYWSYPPHCPSWRRDREHFYAYEDCAVCGGKGYTKETYVSGGRIKEHCADCSRRFHDHPVRRHHWLLSEWINHAGNSVFRSMLFAAAGIKTKAKKRREQELNDWIEANPEQFQDLRSRVLDRGYRCHERLSRLAERRGIWATREPT